MRFSRRTTVLAATVLSGALIAPAAAAAGSSRHDGGRHVLLLSVDGLHQADVTWYVAHHPTSALAALVHRGVDFTHASTPVPSDSFPGMLAQAIFGMNFQAVSTAQKLPTSGGRPGGYLADGVTPGPVLAGALDFIDSQVGSFVNEIRTEGLAATTTIILSTKHGQSPTDPAALTRIPDGPLLAGLNAAWKNAHPGAGELVAHSTDDDAMLLWLTDRSPAAAEFAKAFLLAQSGVGNGITGVPKPFTASGLARVFAGRAAARFFGVPAGDPRVPDLFGIVAHGVVYTGGKSKIAEHGGADPQDRTVPIVLAGAGVRNARRIAEPVETTQIAPTILRLLGVNPRELQAVQREHTSTLPD